MADYRYIALKAGLRQLASDLLARTDADLALAPIVEDAVQLAIMAAELASDVQQGEFESRYLSKT